MIVGAWALSIAIVSSAEELKACCRVDIELSLFLQKAC